LSVKIDQPGSAGEYDAAMQAMLQLIWGDGFLSPGDADEIARLLEGSDLTGCSALDIGCGLGVADLILAERYGAGHVLGIDIEPELIEQARARIEKAGLAGRVAFELVTPGPLPFEGGRFDVVFSKDAIVQIPDKPAIFAEAFRVLKPGGRLIASDWLRGYTGAHSPEMLEFFRLEGITYNMATLEESAAALRAVGFVDVVVADRHAWYRDLARRELDAMEGALKPVMIERIGEERAHHFTENWRQLVIVLERGELRPGHLKAVKPA
jgi:ubiquinone/menaquinone biosynthesis C-methylase UbiE